MRINDEILESGNLFLKNALFFAKNSELSESEKPEGIKKPAIK
ncbi:hypothetical protein PXH59_17050 [Xenorhabdus sp. SF857]|nr:hypothetical protein [Xenorhabdus sp. SF857]WFQ79280.1 hypothetical protein PXH59_17050 [Xenorhabdus sp. SF857]